MQASPEFLANFAVVLCVAGITTVISSRLKLPVIFGYLVAGIIVGPYIPLPLSADPAMVRGLSELGVILLMFSLGLEFRLGKLARVGATSGVIAVIECSVMLWLGYAAGRLFGFSPLESFYAGAIIAISSTTIIIKAFQEARVGGTVSEIVFGVLIAEDLIAILLMTVLTAVSSGGSMTAAGLAATGGRLAAFIVGLLVAGLLVVPRMMRAVVRQRRPETTVVAAVGLCFASALLAHALGYSVALGAFIAGSLVAESGVEKLVQQLVEPVRDIFAAIFFVSVGMLIDPAIVGRHWGIAVAFTLLVVVGKFTGVTFGALLAGRGVRASVQAGMSLAQIGEFSFIIAGIGLSSGATRDFLYPVAVTVSAATTLLTPWLIRGSGAAATRIDRSLPHPLRTFLALYDGWLEQLQSRPKADGGDAAVRIRVRQIALDAIAALVILLGTLLLDARAGRAIASVVPFLAEGGRWIFLAVGFALSLPFLGGALRGIRLLVRMLVAHAMPEAEAGKLDMAAAPRRALVVTLQLGVVLLVGLPVLALLQPFITPLQGAALLLFALLLLGTAFWRSATNLEGHIRAVSEVIADVLSQQAHGGAEATDADRFRRLHEILPGLGNVASVAVDAESPAAGRSLAELNLGALTGATILVLMRGEERRLPTGKDMLAPGDVLALTGTPDAVAAARAMLLPGGRELRPPARPGT